MALLEDLKKSISAMSDEELTVLHSKQRANRMARRTTIEDPIEQKLKALKKLGLTKEMVEKMVAESQGKEVGNAS